VVKDPRICRFLPFFLSVLEDMSIAPVALFSVRNPLEVAFSLRRRDGFPISKSVALWLRHVLEAEFHSRQIPRCFISYENLLKDWRLEMDRASDATGVKWPVDPGSSATSIEQFLTAELHHERTESAGLEKHPDLLFLAAETFHLLGEASRVGTDLDLLGRIDAVRKKFDEASSFFGAILRNEERSVQQLRATLNQKSSELERERQSVEEQKNRQQALMVEEQKKYRQALIEEQKDFQQASLEQQKKYQLALMAEQQKYQQGSAEEQNKLQQALKEMEEKYQQALEDQREYQMAMIAEREKQQQALAEQLSKHEQALEEAQEKHQQALEEQNKHRLALIAEQEKHQQASAEERSRHEIALTDAQNRHQQELSQKERERNEYAARLSTLSAQLAELNNTIGENDTRLNLTIKELTDAFDGKRSEHAKALADLQSSKKMLDEMRGALAASRDVGERQASKLKDLNREIDLHKALLSDCNQQIQAAMAQIQALYASKSWRMTRPFRVAMRFFARLSNLASSNR
jgi:hypothetical protein